MNQEIQTKDIDLPLTCTRPVKKVALVVLTRERGLYGSFNNNVLKRRTPASMSSSSWASRGGGPTAEFRAEAQGGSRLGSSLGRRVAGVLGFH
uniref:Uncharacterized protein n=1 Tax=Setaria viridis TaxID=4556 RepID=A0A4U6W5V5_SETVI|nr:hypothetical protein SEVIR_1G015450v2 [Setaria viridis]